MPDRFTYDVLLSHNSQDKPKVRGLAEELRAAGLRVWFDGWVIKPGDGIYSAMETRARSGAIPGIMLVAGGTGVGVGGARTQRSVVDPTVAFFIAGLLGIGAGDG